MIKRFFNYCTKVFKLPNAIRKLRDKRIAPVYSSQHIWEAFATLMATGRNSLHAIEADRFFYRQGRGDPDGGPPSDDTLGRVAGLYDPQQLRDMLGGFAEQLKRNKALPTEWNLRFAAVDGHEFFSSRKRCCEKCLERTVTVNGKEVREWYHRGVVCHLVGHTLALPLDVEMILPGEGEVDAAIRVLARVFKAYPRLFDAVAGDALYCEAPFFNFCLKHKKDVLAVLKGDDRLLKRDAVLRFSQMAPVAWTSRKRDIQGWDVEGLDSMTGVEHPIRVVHTHEEWEKREQVGREYKTERQESDWWWATTIPAAQLPVRQCCAAGHSRWDIENDNFNQLSTHWGLDHCYKHQPEAILNILLIKFTIIILLQAFYHRNLKPACRNRLTLIALAKELHHGWVAMGRCFPLLPVLDTS